MDCHTSDIGHWFAMTDILNNNLHDYQAYTLALYGDVWYNTITTFPHESGYFPMKRLFAFLLAAVMVMSMCACAAAGDPEISVPETSAGQTDPTETTGQTEPTHDSEPTLPSDGAVCDHLFSLEYLIETTCSQPGRTYGVCEYCGEERYDEIPAIAHDFADASCTKAKTCTVCSVTEGNALGHDYASGTCKRCGDKLPVEIPAGCDHNYKVSGQKAPGCTTAGSISYKCSKCNHLYTETIAATGHKYADATCEQAKTCSVCGATEGNALGHSYADGKCSRCGAADPSVPAEVTYTVKIRSDKGDLIEGVTVSVYTTEDTPAATGKTNSKGIATMPLLSHSSYKIVLSDVPAGYSAKESYTFRSTQANINLTSVSYTTPTDHSKGNYKVGSTMGEFTLTDTDGNSYTLSKLLKEKKLVILNFWYVNCAPCKAEFPYLEAIHQNYSDDVQLLTMSHWDTVDQIVALRQQMGVTFPMIREDIGFREGFGMTMYPTTVFIDSTGKIVKIDVGGYKSEQELVNIIKRYL